MRGSALDGVHRMAEEDVAAFGDEIFQWLGVAILLHEFWRPFLTPAEVECLVDDIKQDGLGRGGVLPSSSKLTQVSQESQKNSANLAFSRSEVL